jgi:hypothetical protein
MDQLTPYGRRPIDVPDDFLAARDPVVAFRFGRGRTGGSTWLDTVIQLARVASRPVLVGDADRRNPTLSGLYPVGGEVSAMPPPTSDETADVKDFLTSAVGESIARRMSLVMDMSGGDRALQEHGRDLGMVEICEAHGMLPLAFFMCGPEMDDFDHIVSIWEAGYFRPRHGLLIFNEHLVAQGRTPVGAFNAIVARPEIKELMSAGVVPIFLPRLACLPEVRKAGLSLLDAATGGYAADGRPFDPVRQFMVRQYFTKILGELGRAGALGWLP